MKELLHVRSQPNNEALAGVKVPSQNQFTEQQACGESLAVPSHSQVRIDAAEFLASSARLPSTPSEMPLQPPEDASRPPKRRRSGFKVSEEPISDFISKGLITVDYAMDCFAT